MSEAGQASDPVDDGSVAARSPGRRVRWPWLPVAFAAAAAVAIVLVRQSDMTRDYRFVTNLASIGLAVLGVAGWFLICGPLALRYRLLLVISPVVLMAAAAGMMRIEFDGDSVPRTFSLLWTKTHDERLEIPAAASQEIEWVTTPFDYPRFLGPHGNGTIDNVELETDWKTHPPREVWRREIGGGWSGFVVVGDFAITQEQRGSLELVVCYRVSDGRVMWTHQDERRFDPATAPGNLGGWGPRATPTVHEGKVFTVGGTGILNCLDAASGKLLWSRDTLAENEIDNVAWGKSCSPLVVDENVVVSVGAGDGRSLIAYDMETGDEVFSGGSRRSSYATPILATLAGVRQIVVTNEDFVTAHDAETGSQLWEHPWGGNSDSDASNSNPLAVGNDRLLLAKGYGVGCELIEIVAGQGTRLSARSLWGRPKPVMKTKMTNPVFYDGQVYGLDGGILQCIELATGEQHWKRGRFGHGQVLLVGDVLLVTYEKTGEVALVAATPEKYRPLAKIKALSRGSKTWNYPALAGGFLLIRNHEEAACFELPVKELSPPP